MTGRRQRSRARSDLRAAAHRAGRARLVLRGALVAALVVVTAHSLVDLVTSYAPYVDLEIPLRAAERWMAGGQPYLASSFAAPPGYDLPFLYPPPVLPLVAPLTLLPRGLVWTAWFGACLGAGVFAVRRLGFRWRFVPFVLLWPPFAEAIIGGNVQVVLFAAFVTVFWTDRGRTRNEVTHDRDGPTDARDGVFAVLVPFLKVSQPQALVALLRIRPRAAVIGTALLAGVLVTTLPLTGPDLWRAWLAQLGRAADPAWGIGGASLTRGLPALVGSVVLGATVVGCLTVPRRRLGAWAGVLTVLGAPSLRMFGVQFCLPAMLEIRREIALVAAMLVATYTLPGLWGGIALVAVAFAASERYPLFSEPRTGGDASTAARREIAANLAENP
jgi:hypothetical protein